MTKHRLDQQAQLAELITVCYGGHGASLQAISPYFFAERGIYRVDFVEGGSFVLRAFRIDVEDSLLGHAAILNYLYQQQFPAVSLRPTIDGATLARYAGWTALLVTYIEGVVADFSLASLEMLAAYIARLHNLVLSISGQAAVLPESRFHQGQYASQAIANLLKAQPPTELCQFCADAIVTLQRVQQASQAGLLPEALVHGDCWPGNAIHTSKDNLAMIDWDCAGIGPAVLDLGYLLLTSHLGKPQLPAMQPDKERIEAVMRGYCRHRRPTDAEVELLEDAVFYDVARRAGYDNLLANLSDSWRDDIWLQKSQARYRVSPSIARIARNYLA